MFRTAEAIMKYFDGYYQQGVDNEIASYLTNKYYAIRKPNKVGMPVNTYHILDLEFVAAYFNRMVGVRIIHTAINASVHELVPMLQDSVAYFKLHNRIHTHRYATENATLTRGLVLACCSQFYSPPPRVVCIYFRLIVPG